MVIFVSRDIRLKKPERAFCGISIQWTLGVRYIVFLIYLKFLGKSYGHFSFFDEQCFQHANTSIY
jgi:hypothetical protein